MEGVKNIVCAGSLATGLLVLALSFAVYNKTPDNQRSGIRLAGLVVAITCIAAAIYFAN